MLQPIYELEQKWRERLATLNTWKRGGERAVHKPLLTLMLIARAEEGQPRQIRFAEIEKRLKDLLRQFGPSRKSYHPEFPFWHLQSDGFWCLRDPDKFPRRKGGKSPSFRTLLNADATGYVPKDLWQELVANVHLRSELTRFLLEEFWPQTQHAAIYVRR